MHVHVGVRGADRAIAVCDRLRAILPELLAVSANSPFLDGADSGLHSARTQIFTKSFPRCGIPERVGRLGELRRIRRLPAAHELDRGGTRSSGGACGPHHSFGTVELRICDAQTTAEESSAIAGLAAACIAQAAIDYDEGVRPESPRAAASSRRTSGARSATGSTAR